MSTRDKQQALGPAERRNRQILESAVDYAIVSCDLDARITSWNEGARLILGWSAEEMLGQSIHRIFTPDNIADGVPEREFATALKTGGGMDERWHVRKNGEFFWASGELMLLKDESGYINGFVKFLRDRTAQRQAENELRKLNETVTTSEARLQLALELGRMGAWQADIRTQRSVWWPGMDLVHGLPAGTPAVPMCEYDQLVHPDDRERVREVMQGALARRVGYQVEYRVLWPDGSVHWLEGRGKLFTDSGGQALSISGVCVDITSRMKSDRDRAFLAQASAELANLSELQDTLDKIARLAVPYLADWCAVHMLDEDGTLNRVAVAHVNPEKAQLAREFQRRSPPSRDNRDPAWSVLEAGKAQLVQEISDETLHGAVADPEYLETVESLGLRSYIGAPLTVQGRTAGVIVFVAADSGRHYEEGDLALAEDLARRAAVAIENAKLLRALKDSDRAKDVFLATLAHELRSPLAPIRHGVSLIQLSAGSTGRIMEVAGIIERQLAQLTRLVEDLLDVSRINTGKIEMKKESTNLVTILNSAIETARPNIEAAQHRLSMVFSSDPTSLHADPVRLAQVFANLLNNAAKYTPPGGDIRVQVQSHDDRLEVRVRDSGIGIPQEMLGSVFKLFTQVTHPAERRQGGLGIGLSLVEGLVKLHGGSVQAFSEGPGHGSEFVVTLPRAESAPQPQAPPPAVPETPSRPAAGSRRILVVDDSGDAAQMVADLLEMFGSTVAVAHDGTSAVEKTREFRPDVVLLDIGLPDINGYEVARRIRKLEGVRQPMLVALTGWGQLADKKQAEHAGFDQHWTKPVDTAKLREVSVR